MNYEKDKIGILVGSNCDTYFLPNLVGNVKQDEALDDEDDDIFEELAESKRELIFFGSGKQDVKFPYNKSNMENGLESIMKSEIAEERNLNSVILKSEEIDIKTEEDTSYIVTSNSVPRTKPENENPPQSDSQSRNYETIREKPIKSNKKRKKMQLPQNKNIIYKCDYCNFETRYKKSFSIHSFQHKNASEVKMHKCLHCKYQSIHKDYLRSHSLRHIPRYISCDKGKMPKLVLRTYQTKHSWTSLLEADVFMCTKCNFECPSKYSLNQHLLECVASYKCPKCDYRTSDRSNLRRHIFLHDETKKAQYTCDKCGVNTTTKYALKCHILRHNTPQINKFTEFNRFPVKECRYCDYKAKYKSNLLIHELEHDNSRKIKVYACENCDFRTIYKASIDKHTMKHIKLQTKAEKIALLKCNKCSFETHSKHSLNHHQLLHKSCEEVDIYKCPECDYKTIHKGNLMRHDKHHHAREVEIYQCYECDHKTTRKDELKNHIFRHKKFRNH